MFSATFSATCRTSVIACIAAVVLTAGCASPKLRPVQTEDELRERAQAENMRQRQVFEQSVEKILGRAQTVSERDGALDFLAMSGGGDFGAFGAGFLVGWGSLQSPGLTRPDFDVVTGVSTGALLAPFAFAGTDEDFLAAESMYRNPKKDWLRERGLLFFLPSNPSFMELPGLERDVRQAISEPLIRRVAEESRKGRVLAISATDLEFGRQTFWDLGSESERAVDAEGMDRVQRMLLASAAIPAVFPPVEVDGALCADGGVTANVFLRLDHRNPKSFINRWKNEHPGKDFPKLRYWVIVNNQLHQPPATVQAKWPEVLGPSLATAIRSATLAEIRWLTAEVEFVNATYGTQIELRMVAIPDSWRAPVKGDFKKETMNSLADLGRKLGADPSCWTELVVPKPVVGQAVSARPAIVQAAVQTK